jgi:hypothetical protein
MWPDAVVPVTHVGPVMTFIHLYQPPVVPTQKISSPLFYSWLIFYDWGSNSEFVLVVFWVQ